MPEFWFDSCFQSQMKVSGSGLRGCLHPAAPCGCTGAVLVLHSFHARFEFDRNKGVRMVKQCLEELLYYPQSTFGIW